MLTRSGFKTLLDVIIDPHLLNASLQANIYSIMQISRPTIILNRRGVFYYEQQPI
jgi:hypothetical protein